MEKWLSTILLDNALTSIITACLHAQLYKVQRLHTSSIWILPPRVHQTRAMEEVVLFVLHIILQTRRASTAAECCHQHSFLVVWYSRSPQFSLTRSPRISLTRFSLSMSAQVVNWKENQYEDTRSTLILSDNLNVIPVVDPLFDWCCNVKVQSNDSFCARFADGTIQPLILSPHCPLLCAARSSLEGGRFTATM